MLLLAIYERGNHRSLIAWWRHQMETFSALLTICAGNSPVPVNFPHKGQWRGALMFALICVWINAPHLLHTLHGYGLRLHVFHTIITGYYFSNKLTHGSLLTHVCVGKLDPNWRRNYLSAIRRQVVIWTNDDLLAIGRLKQTCVELNPNIYLFFHENIIANAVHKISEILFRL